MADQKKPHILVIWGDDIGIPAGVVSNEIVQHHDWLPTFLAAAGKTFKLHLDGFNLLPYLTGQQKKSPRKGYSAGFREDGSVGGRTLTG